MAPLVEAPSSAIAVPLEGEADEPVGALALWPRVTQRAWRWLITAAAGSMVLDVATQALDLHPVWHAARLGTGFAFGYAVAAASVQALRDEAELGV